MKKDYEGVSWRCSEGLGGGGELIIDKKRVGEMCVTRAISGSGGNNGRGGSTGRGGRCEPHGRGMGAVGWPPNPRGGTSRKSDCYLF